MARSDRARDFRWRFHRLGGFDQVRIETGADVCHLAELDQKLWAALSCPTTGLELDTHTLALLDTDEDGRIRVPEILAAADWTCRVLKNPDDLVKGESVLPLSAINTETDEGRRVLESARNILANLGKPDAEVITAEDTADTGKIFATARFNGDGVVPTASATDPEIARAIADIITCVGSMTDRSGAQGISPELCEHFFTEARAYSDWWAEAEADPANLLPLGEATESARHAVDAVKAKIDDFFTRTRLAEYDRNAAGALNPSEGAYLAVSVRELSDGTDDIAAFPIARIEAKRALPLDQGVNPAWSAALREFRDRVVNTLLGPHQELTETEWLDIRRRFAANAAWMARMQGAAVDPLGIQRVRELLSDGTESAIRMLIEEDLKLAEAVDAIVLVDRLVHYYRYLFTLLNNFVCLTDFYSGEKKAIFQAGTLFLDGRSCELCIQVKDIDAHSAMASLSRTYLAYCHCVRRGGTETMSIVAAMTGGHADNLMVGRNGIFYDRHGRDWDATVTKIVEQPIGVGEAFWRPYKRIARMVSEQIEKFAGERDKAVDETAGKGLAEAATAGPAAAPAASGFDIAKFAGIFAALGLAVGAIGTALATVLASLFNLAWWQIPLAVLGVILAISGPSMLLAYLKLRARNLGPLLDGNGWAINSSAKINIPFGASLTRLAERPRGSEYSLIDPFAEKRRPWRLYLVLLVLLGVLFFLWREGHIARGWAQLQQMSGVVEETAPPADATQEAASGAEEAVVSEETVTTETAEPLAEEPLPEPEPELEPETEPTPADAAEPQETPDQASD